MNNHRRPIAELGRPRAILVAGALALLCTAGCGSTVSVASPVRTPLVAVGPAESSTPATPTAAATTGLPATQTPTAAASLRSPVVAITVGTDHTCAITAGGGVECWGLNSFGELGNGSTTGLSSTPVNVTGLHSGITALAASQYDTCALTGGGGVKCWGLNSQGQLGDGSKTNRSAPVDVVGLARGITAISANLKFACALTGGGGVKCWGALNLPLLLGPVPTLKRTPFQIAGLPSGISAIAAGLDFTCALKADGGVRCWGSDVLGTLGDGSKFGLYRTPVGVKGLTSGVAAISADGGACALTAEGGVKCWGANQDGQLGTGSTSTDSSTPLDVAGLASGITAVAVGFDHACALTSGGGVKCWGDNSAGELGDGSTTNSSTPVDVTGLASGVASITAGGFDTCAITSTGDVKCWGDNSYGQLGDGTTTNRQVPVTVNLP
jgi:alpha-tubulin suppressor-like RCC1 family protein